MNDQIEIAIQVCQLSYVKYFQLLFSEEQLHLISIIKRRNVIITLTLTLTPQHNRRLSNKLSEKIQLFDIINSTNCGSNKPIVNSRNGDETLH